MEVEIFDLLFSAIIFLIYSAICIISVIFTFSLDTYLKINEKLNMEIIPGSIAVFETGINWLDTWLVNHHKIVGPILILLSLFDIKLTFYIINNL